jgi:hypothetical protein
MIMGVLRRVVTVRLLFVLLVGCFGDALLATLPGDVRGGLMHDVP